jgi:hypothetical protein
MRQTEASVRQLAEALRQTEQLLASSRYLLVREGLKQPSPPDPSEG